MTASSIPSWGKASPSFATTRWSLVLAAGQGETKHSQAALATLCETYWYPLYASVRRRGFDAQEAQDLTQGFFARLLDKGDLVTANPERGRFRAFLSVAIKNFIQNEWRRENAQKRGGGRAPVSLDLEDAESRYRLDATDERTPEKLFDRAWALVLLERVMERLRESYESSGKGRFFEVLQGTLTASGPAEKYSDLGEKLGMKEGAVKVAIHRLRKRYRAELQHEISGTVSDPEEVQAELADLFDALAE